MMSYKNVRNVYPFKAGKTYPNSKTGAGDAKVVAGIVDASVSGSLAGYKPKAAALGVEQALELSDGAAVSTVYSGTWRDEFGRESSRPGISSSGGVWCALLTASSKIARRLKSL
jgi:hypothetical protein